jgi:hypothetical protein
MATLIPFTPSATANPAFQTTVVLDGVSYMFVAMWNFYSGRFYFSLTDQNGNLIINMPLIGSPPGTDILLGVTVPPTFTTSTLVYRPSTGNIEVTP